MHKITDKELIDAIVNDWLKNNDRIMFNGKMLFLKCDGTPKTNDNKYAALLTNIIESNGDKQAIENLRLELLKNHDNIRLYEDDYDQAICDLTGENYMSWFDCEECGRCPRTYFDCDDELKEFYAEVSAEGNSESYTFSFYDIINRWRKNELRIGTYKEEFLKL